MTTEVEDRVRHAEELRRMIDSGEQAMYFSKEGNDAFEHDSKLNHAIRDCLKDFTEEADKLVRALYRVAPREDWGELTDLRQKAHHTYHSWTNKQVWAFINNDLDYWLRRLRRIRF